MSQGANTSELAQMEAPSESVNPEHGLPESFGEGLLGRLLFWIAVSFSTFQIVTSFGVPLDRPFLAGLTLNHFLAVAMAAWAVWLAAQGARRGPAATRFLPNADPQGACGSQGPANGPCPRAPGADASR